MQTVVVAASLSESSSTQQLGNAIAEAVQAELGGEVVHMPLRELAHAITDNMLTGFPSPELEAAFEQVKGADAVVAVTPAYNGSYSGLFKSFFDVLPEEMLRGKPVAIGATGGTPRHSLVTEHAIRPMFTYLRAVTAPTAVFAATEDFGAHAADSDGAGGASLGSRIERVARELATIVRAQNPQAFAQTGGTTWSVSKAAVEQTEQVDTGMSKTDQPDIQAARELFDDFKPMDELFG